MTGERAMAAITAILTIGEATAGGDYPLSLLVYDGEDQALEAFRAKTRIDPAALQPDELRLRPASAVGKTLHDVLINAVAGHAWAAAVNAGGDGGSTIYLDIRPTEFRAMPWESMVSDDRRCLFLDERVVWARSAMRRAAAPPLRSTVQALVVVADPTSEAILAEDEIDAMTAAVRDRTGEWLIEVLYGPTSEELSHALQLLRPDVLHLIGHAGPDPSGTGALDIKPRGGRIWGLSADRVVNTAALQAHPPRLVVLNACRTAEDTRTVCALSKAFEDIGAHSIVSMQADLPSAAAVTFTRAVYQRLAAGRPIGEAIRTARQAVYQTEAVTPWLWAVPSLVTQDAGDALLRTQFPARPELVRRCYPATATLADRTEEQRQIWSALEPGRAGIMVTGPPQIGKSALLQSCLHTAQLRGADACYADLARHVQRPLWLDVLRAIRDAASASLPAGAEPLRRFNDSLAQLSRGLDPLPPDSRPLLPDPGDAWSYDVEREPTMRRGVFAAFLRMLADLATPGLIVAIDHLGNARDTDVTDHLVPHLLLPLAARRVPGVRLVLTETIENLRRLLPPELLQLVTEVPVRPMPRTERIFREFGVRKQLAFTGSWRDLVKVCTSDGIPTELLPSELQAAAMVAAHH
jgi:hypothetical protein